MELLNSIFNFFTDKTKKFSHKTILVIVSITFLAFLDNTLNFTNHYNISRKLNDIEKINRIIIDSSLDNVELKKLTDLRTNIIERKSWKDKVYDKIVSLDLNEIKFTKVDKNVELVKKERNYWYHFISSSWSLILMMIIMPFIGLFDKKNTFLSTFFTVIFIIEPIFYSISWVFAKIFSYIPIINGNPIYNYVLNAVIHLGIFLLIGVLSKKKEIGEIKAMDDNVV